MTQTPSKQMTTRRSRSYIAGVAISWIAVYGAIVGFTNLVPFLPYPGGGGYFPFAVVMAAVGAFVLGPWGGAIAALIGGLIGIFVTPAGYPMGVLDAIQVATYPALFTGLAVTGNKNWKIFTPIILAFAVLVNIVPYYVPGPSAGFSNPPQPFYFLIMTIYWLPWLIIYLSPIGRKYIPMWSKSDNTRKMIAGVYLPSLIAFMIYYTSNTFWAYWLWLAFPVDLTIVESLYFYTWYLPLFAAAATIVAIAIVKALKRSGLQAPADSIW